MDTNNLVMTQNDEFISSIRLVVNEIIQTNGELKFFALFGDLHSEDTVSAFVSAKWLDDMTSRKGLELITGILFSKLSKEMLTHISRVTIVNTQDDYIKKLIGQTFSIRGSVVVLRDCRINNIYIPYAIILESIPDD
jgi:hypothetical protein